MSAPNPGQILLYAALATAGAAFARAAYLYRRREGAGARVTAGDLATGFVTALGDTLGIGSFAPTTAIFKLRGAVDDENIPGTLNVGHTVTAILEAVIFISAVLVEPTLLVCVIGSAALGAWTGAGVVGRLDRRSIQLAMGSALLVACVIFTAVNLRWMPGGGAAMALSGWKFAVAVGCNFVFGALMSVGIGLYAPCMIVLALLGMHPIAAFPIMTGACALLQPVASLRFFGNRRFSWRASVGLTLGGVPGVLIAAYVIKALDMTYLRWLVTVVVLYTAGSMLSSAQRERRLAVPVAVATQP